MKNPDWELWLDFDQVEAWQAVALSLNVDPDGLEHCEYQLKPFPVSTEIAELFSKRARRLSRRIIFDFKTYGGRAATYGSATDSLPLHNLIKLADFATWAEKHQWSLPERLLVLVRDSLAWSEMASSHVENEAKDLVLEPDLGNNLSKSESGYSPILQVEQENKVGLTKREKQIRAIEAAIQEKGYNPMNILTGCKGLLKKKCKEEHPLLFGGGDDPFKEAWQAALDNNRIRTEKHDQYGRK